jgi:SAM-dependent methyltransferase
MSEPPTATSNAARQRAHWDRVLSADNIAERPLTADALRRELAFVNTPDFRALRRAAAARRDPLILDLGGGLGTHAVALAAAGHRVIVADVSGARLRALKRVIPEMKLAGKVLLVQTAAEQLALRTNSIDVAWTKAVLIHCDLDETMAEIARCLGVDGEAVLSEPTDANPLVNLYRRRAAPKEWQSLATYFSPEREARVLSALRGSKSARFHVVSFLAYFWQFAVRAVWLFRPSLAVLGALDAALMRVWPAYRRRAWIVVMTGRGRST